MEEEDYTPSLDELIIIDEEETTPVMEDFEESTDTEDNTTDQEVDTKDNTNEDEDVSTEEETSNEETIEEDNIEEEETEEEPEVKTEVEGNEQLQQYYNFLSQAGVMALPDDYKFDGTQEGFLQAIEDSKTNMQNAVVAEIWQALPPDFQTLLEYGLNGGTDINKVLEVVNSTPLDVTRLDIENVEHQKEIVRQYLTKTTKYSEKKINDRIRMFEQSNILEQEAEAAYPELRNMDKAERQKFVEQQAAQAQLEEEEMLKAFGVFQDVTKEMQVSDSRKEQILAAVWGSGTYGNKSQSYVNYVEDLVYNNPEHYAQLVNIFLDYDPVKGFNSVTKTKSRKAKTDAAINLRNSLNELLNTSIPKGSKSKNKGGSTDFDFDMFNKLNS